MVKVKLMGDLVVNWIAEQLRKDNSNLQELCEYVRDNLVIAGKIARNEIGLDAPTLSQWRKTSRLR